MTDEAKTSSSTNNAEETDSLLVTSTIENDTTNAVSDMEEGTDTKPESRAKPSLAITIEKPEDEEKKVDQKRDGKEEKEEAKYKCSDFELEMDVQEMQKRFKHVLDKYSGFDEDIYQVPESELMDILGKLSIDSYGILLWVLCMGQLETQRMKVLWDIMQFLSMRMPTEVAMDLLLHYSSQMARYSAKDVDDLGKALVYGSRFPLATCLKLSAFFKERANADLTQKEQLQELSDEYAIRATQILEEIENDYLAVLVLETPSFHEHQSPLEIALDNNITHFLAGNKVSRIANAIWTSNELMKMDAYTNAFSSSSFEISSIHKSLLENSYAFYFSSIGYFMVEVLTYLIYLFLFTYFTLNSVKVDDNITFFDIIFWLMNFGFISGEILELSYDGWKEYTAKWQNSLDITICANFFLIILMRIFFRELLSEGQKENLGIDRSADADQIQWIDIVFKIIWSTNVVILWLRLLFFMMISQTMGPLIANVKNMMTDILSFLKMYLIIAGGFIVGIYFLVGGADGSYLFRRFDVSIVTLFKTTLGEVEWECVFDIAGVTAGTCDYYDEEDSPDVSEARITITTFMLVLFTVLTLVVLFNLLTGMMATTFADISGNAEIEVLSRKVSIGIEYDRDTQIMPPPFNIFVIILYLVYNIIDALLLITTRKFISSSFGTPQWRCHHCRCLNTYEKDDEDAFITEGNDIEYICKLCNGAQFKIEVKSRYLRNPREMKQGDTWCQILKIGFRELFDMAAKEHIVAAQKRKSEHKDDNDAKTISNQLDIPLATPGTPQTPMTPVGLVKAVNAKVLNETANADWICGYCRQRIPAGTLGDVNAFKKRLTSCDIRVDEDDIDVIEQLNPPLCPICYRTVNIRSRMVFVMELMSYYIFLFVIYPLIRICLIPVYIFIFSNMLCGEAANVSDEDEDETKSKSQLNTEQKKTQSQIAELLPSDQRTSLLLKRNNKVWSILAAWKERKDKINQKPQMKMAFELQQLEKKTADQEEEHIQKQRSLVVAQLSNLVDDYYKSRVEQSENAKRRTTLLAKQRSVLVEGYEAP